MLEARINFISYFLIFRIKTSIKGVVEQSSVFASEIFTAISQIPEEPPEVIHINEMHEMP